MNALLATLRRILPATLMALLVVILSATGFFLHWSPRFESIAWGLTEMVHVWVGWAALLATAGYLAHHLARTWGPWTTLQRILGLLLAADLAVAMLTGVLVVWPPEGGPPAWAVPLHFVSTFGILGLFLWHSAVGWIRWLKRRWRLILDGPQAGPESSEPSPPESDQGDEPQHEGDAGADEAGDEGEGAVDQPE